MNKHRENIIREIVSNCEDNYVIKDKLNFISILGSTRTDEAIEGYSDLDILFIFDSNKSGAIGQDVLRDMKKMAESFSEKYKIEISFLTHTIFDFEEYVDFNYLVHYSWGEVIFGSKSGYDDIFKKIIDKKYSEEERKRLTYYNLIHARFNLIRKYVSWNEANTNDYKKKILQLIIDNVIEMCDWALVYKNLFKKTKKEVSESFKKEFSLKHNHIISDSINIRDNWGSYTFEEEEFDEYIDDSILFVQEIVDVIHKEHEKN